MSRVLLRCTILGLLALSVVIIPATRTTAQPGPATSTSDQPNSPVYLGIITTVNATGTQVQQVVANSPAAAAGFQPGDIVIAVDLSQVLLDQPLETLLSKHHPGDQVQITIKRGGTSRILSVILMSRADAPSTGTIPLTATGVAIAATTIPAAGPLSTVSALLLTPGPVALQNATATSTPSSPGSSATNTANSVPGSGMIGPVTTGDAINSSLDGATSTGVVATVVTAQAASPIQATVQPAVVSTNGAYLGVRVVGETDGLFVAAVQAGSPAASAGMAIADIIISIDNTPLHTPADLQNFLNNKRPGDSVRLQLTRADKPISISVILTARPASSNAAATVAPAVGSTPDVPLVSVPMRAQFTPIGLLTLLRVDGLQVVQVTPGGLAAQGGLQVNDLIIAVNGQAFNVGNVSPVFTALLSGQPLTVAALRNGQRVQAQIAASGAVASTTGPQTRLGVSYTVVTPTIATAKNLAVTDGALVTAVVSGSPADVAGIKVGDVITSVDGDKVDAKRTLALRMLPYTSGDKVTLGIQRGTQVLTVSVTFTSAGSA